MDRSTLKMFLEVKLGLEMSYQKWDCKLDFREQGGIAEKKREEEGFNVNLILKGYFGVIW